MPAPDPTQAWAEITGEYPNQVLNLNLPRGDRGEKGEKGDKGDQGDIGLSTTLTVVDTVTGPETAGATGPQGLTGPKGDPGGIVLGTILGTSDLNAIISAGTYYQSDAASGTLARNYPKDVVAGNLVVFQAATSNLIKQVFYPINGAFQGKLFYVRQYNTNAWTTWAAYGSSRVDQTAGRAIYQWDDVNSREQLIYGDTGERDITPLINGTAAAFKIRRSGNVVEIVCVNWQPTANGQAVLLAPLPTGWRNTNTHAFFTAENSTSLAKNSNLGASGSNITIGGNATTSTYSFFLTYITLDPWPTSLIGNPAGSIPNL